MTDTDTSIGFYKTKARIVCLAQCDPVSEGYRMFGWYILQATAGVITIVLLIDSGLSKDEPYLVKLGFAGAFCATWLISKALDLIIYVQERMGRSS